MKFYILPYTLIVMLFISCTTGLNTKVNPGFQHFRISIEQDSAIKEINNHIAKLEKKPFTIIISFLEHDSILLNASFKSESYFAALNGDSVDTITGFKNPPIDEELFNKEALIYISDNSPNYWYYTNENDHRFSEIIEKSGILFCRRNITSVYILDKNKKMDIADLKENEIYLVFMKTEWNNDFSKKIEIKREYLKIEFTDSDKNKKNVSSYRTLKFNQSGDFKIN